jgi:hypothetical protein
LPRHLATVAAILGLALITGAPTGAAARPVASIAKTCSAGYVHAVIGGREKCLRHGELCAHRYERQYRRYGFDCTTRDRRGNYHLT